MPVDAARLRLRFALAMGLASSACSKETPRTETTSTPTASTSASTSASATTTTTTAVPKLPTGAGGSGCGFDVVCQPEPASKICAPSYTEPRVDGGVAPPRTGTLYQEAPQHDAGACCYRLARRFCGGGRPLRAEDGPILAPFASRGDWVPESFARERAGQVAPHDVALAQRWLREAAFEHASVASFARVSLQLMALGAPPELLADTQRAALDEIHHARTFLALAERRGAGKQGPGPLAVDRAPLSTTYESFVVDTFLDGCLAETVSGIEIRTKADDGDAIERAALSAIADDEERHAELAWRMLAWAVRAGGMRARSALEAAVHTVDTRDPITRDVVLPCVRALLDAHQPPTEASPFASAASEGSSVGER